MLSELFLACFHAAALTVFFLVNVLNMFGRGSQGGGAAYAEVQRPSGLFFSVAAFGTFLFFLISAAIPFLVFTGLSGRVDPSFMRLRFEHMVWVQLAGLVVEAVGYVVFLWSVVERGRFAVSWEMRGDHRLVTSGPYSYVRHPSYLGYFLMFAGLFLAVLHLAALAPLVAVPGYVKISVVEEQMLQKRFGDEFAEYQGRTGRFIPKIRRGRSRGP